VQSAPPPQSYELRCSRRRGRMSRTHAVFEPYSFGTPRCAGPSTNASCQPEQRENSQAKTWGSAPTPGGKLAPPRNRSSNRRKRAARKNLRNVADTGETGGGRCCQQERTWSWGWKVLAPHPGRL
jgi:hypothetical protein